MEIVKCGNGHYYNPELYSECPECTEIKERSDAEMLDDGLDMDALDVSGMSRMRKRFVFCLKCQALIDKSFSRCPKCGEMTQDPMCCDKNLLSALLWKGELSKYEKYIWNPKQTGEELEMLVIEYYDRVFHIRNRKLIFEKKSSVHMGSAKERLIVELSQDELDSIQKQLEKTPFVRWMTPISNLNHEYDMGDTSQDFWLKYKNGVEFVYGSSYSGAPGYLKLCALLWDIVTSSPDYFPELDNDPAYDDAEITPEFHVELYCETSGKWIKCSKTIYDRIEIGNHQEADISIVSPKGQRSSCNLVCWIGSLCLTPGTGVCIAKDGEWQKITENTAVREGDKFIIGDAIFVVQTYRIMNPSAKKCGINQKRLLRRLAEEEIFKLIDRQSLQKNIENVCHILVSNKGNICETTDENWKRYPTAGFDPVGIMQVLYEKEQYASLLESLDLRRVLYSNMSAIEVLWTLGIYQCEDDLIENPEENEHIENGDILKLLLRMDDLLMQWLIENDKL